MSVLNKKAELYGFPVNDFFVLIIIELVLFLVSMFGLMKINAYLGITFMVLVGGFVYTVMYFKRLLPHRFFISLYKFLTEPKIYITTVDVNRRHPLIKKIMTLNEEQGNAGQ